MSITYTPTTNFGSKDSLPSNDPNKVIRGAEFTTEFTAIQSAFGLAAPASNPTFTGTATFDNVTASTVSLGSVTASSLTVNGAFTSPGINDNANATAITIDANENVGIGTDSPSDKLHVYSGASGGTPHIYTELVVENDGHNAIQLLSPDAYEQAIWFGDATSPTAGGLTYNHPTNDMSFRVNDSVQMVIDSSGNVGIGVSSMDNPLHVGVTPNTASKTSGSAFDGGALRIDGNLANAGDESAILGGANDGLSAGIGFMRESGGNWGTALKFYTHSPSITTTDELTEAMRIDSDGNLKVANGGRIYVMSSTGFSPFMGESANGLDFWTNTAKRMTIDSSGNVGIGTDAPSSPLTAQANTSASAIKLYGRADGISTIGFIGNNQSTEQGYLQGRDDQVRVWAGSNNFLSLGAGGSERLRITASGTTKVTGGFEAAQPGAGTNAFAAGVEAGETAQGDSAVAVGFLAGKTTQGDAAIGVGRYAGNDNQGTQAVAIGNAAAAGDPADAAKGQGDYGVAIGYTAGWRGQGESAVAIGRTAGYTDQGTSAVAVGRDSGKTNQNGYTVAVGVLAGESSQGESAISIGNGAGRTSQGDSSIAIGKQAGLTNQGANGIIISSRGTTENNADDGHILIRSTEGYLFLDPVADAWTFNGGDVTVPNDNLLVGRTSPTFGTGIAGVALLDTGRGLFEATSDAVLAINRQDGTGSANIVQFYRGNNLAGTITAASGAAPTFAANSDIRLKDNVVDHESELANVMALRPTRWDWKDEALGTGEGFIAQELEQTAWSDLVSEGDDGFKTVAGLGAVETRLIKALQEAVGRIESLEAEVEALKNA